MIKIITKNFKILDVIFPQLYFKESKYSNKNMPKFTNEVKIHFLHVPNLLMSIFESPQHLLIEISFKMELHIETFLTNNNLLR